MISNADYHADPAVSASHLHAVAKSPAYYYARFLNPDRPPSEQTAAMRIGSLVHCAVLEPDEVSKRYAVAPDRRTKAGKEHAEHYAANGIEAVSPADMALAQSMAAAVRQDPIAAALLKTGAAEQSFWWDDAATGLRCKCRPDWLTANGICVDLKTTTDASPAAFARSVATWRYHVQQEHYLSGLPDISHFVFIVVEKSYPYSVAVYELDEHASIEGGALRMRDMHRIATCTAADDWPGYSSAMPTLLSLPRWAYDDTITPEDF
jgi:exodeoxyribonuclease VIII